MSDTIARDTRSKRIHSEEVKIAKQVRLAKRAGREVVEPHRYAKHNALNCGVPGCVMCANPRRTFNERTVKEKSFDQTREWDIE